MTVRPHGGDVEQVARETGIPAARILDFSASLNPRGLPEAALERLRRDVYDARILAQYPDPEAAELKYALASGLDLPADSIAIGAGADALIQAVVRAVAPRRCVIPIPAFSEYARVARAAGCAILTIPLDRTASFALPDDALSAVSTGDLVLLNNPHNPTGACTGRDRMLALAAAIHAAGARVLVDEAFVDYAPEAAITRLAAASGAIAIRSLTKFYGCAGLRVGYAVAAPETIGEIARHLPSWPVSTLALNALAAAVTDSGYIRATLETNGRARTILAEGLSRLGCRVFPPAANFIFLELPDGISAAAIRERLIHGYAILVRGCDSFPGLEPGRYLRVAVRTEAENARLVEALAITMKESPCRQPA